MSRASVFANGDSWNKSNIIDHGAAYRAIAFEETCDGSDKITREPQKTSFEIVEGVCTNQVVVGAAVKRERGADNFCLLRRRKMLPPDRSDRRTFRHLYALLVGSVAEGCLPAAARRVKPAISGGHVDDT